MFTISPCLCFLPRQLTGPLWHMNSIYEFWPHACHKAVTVLFTKKMHLSHAPKIHINKQKASLCFAFYLKVSCCLFLSVSPPKHHFFYFFYLRASILCFFGTKLLSSPLCLVPTCWLCFPSAQTAVWRHTGGSRGRPAVSLIARLTRSRRALASEKRGSLPQRRRIHGEGGEIESPFRKPLTIRWEVT